MKLDLPLGFEENRGQAPATYRYIFNRNGVCGEFSEQGVDFRVRGSARRVRMELVGGKLATPVGSGLLPGKSNYFFGNDASRWVHGAAQYARVEMNEVYRGVSLSFYGNGAELEHDFVVEPGADPRQIAFRVAGAERVALEKNGDLAIDAGGATMKLRRPVAYQMNGMQRESVEAEFVLGEDGVARFRLGGFDAKRRLVIDPVFTFSTYLGGTGTDNALAVATDAAGNIYVTGSTTSTDFPLSNPEQGKIPECTDGYCQNAFVTKVDPTGSTLLFSTYLGGAYADAGMAVAVDGKGNVIVAGTAVTSGFPHAGAIQQPACQINWNCFFIASLTPDGSTLNYAGMIGGGQTGGGSPVLLALDASGNAYMTGVTDDPNFQITQGTLASSVTGYSYQELAVMKIDSQGNLVYSTVVPGNATADPSTTNNEFTPGGIVVDAQGHATVTGTAGLGLPTTSGVVGPAFPNSTNSENPEAGFALRLNATASALDFATYLPGTDSAGGVAPDGSGNFYIAGATHETTLAVSTNAYQKSPGASGTCYCSAGYILKLNALATAVTAATYVNGKTGFPDQDPYTSFSSLVLDNKGNPYVGGMTNSQDFPMQDPFVTTWEYTGGASEMVLAGLSADLSTLEFGSFLNPTDGVFAGSLFGGIAMDANNHLTVVGITDATDFPTTAGSFEATLPPPTNPQSSPPHGFIAKIDLATPASSVCLGTLSISFGTVPAKTSANQTLEVKNCGNAPLSLTSLASSDPSVVASQSCGSIAVGSVCPITLTFTPLSSGAFSGTITLADNAVISPQVAYFSGRGQAPYLVPSPNLLSFGHLLAGTQGPITQLLLRNEGNAPLAITGITLSGSSFTLASNSCVGTMPAPGGCYLQLGFAPTSSGPLSGALVIDSNDPVNPQLVIVLSGVGDSSYSVPSINSISQGTFMDGSTVQINNGPVTIQVSGSNFYPASTVQVNGVSQTTTFQNGNLLQATIAASSLTSLGELPLTVVNPAPGGGTSVPVTITPYETLTIDPSFVVFVPATNLLYAAIPAASSSNPNTVIPINPATGAAGAPIPVGNDPRLLAASSDGSYLYVALYADQTVQRINLTTQAVERTFAFQPIPTCPTGCSNIIPTDLKSVPGVPQEVVLAEGSWLALYNDSGLVNYVPSSSVEYFAPTFNSIAFAGNPQSIYALPFTSVQNPFFTIVALSSSGLGYTPISGTNYGGNNTTGDQVVSDGTLLYTSAGEVWNPVTQTEVGTFPVTIYNEVSSLDTSLGEIFDIGYQDYGLDSSAVVLSAFGKQSLKLSGTLAFPQIDYPVVENLVSWGTDGFAFIAAGAGLTDQELYLTRSSVAQPPSSNPVPSLSSLSPASLTLGWGGFWLEVNGAGFVPGSVVYWNSTALQTSYISSSQLLATGPDSLVASLGTAQVTVTSPAPGGGTSNALSLPIVAASPTATLSASSLSFGSINLGSSSTPQPITLLNTGTAAVTISSIAAKGDFASTSTCGMNLAAQSACEISVVFSPTATGQRSGTITLTDNAGNSPQIIMLSGTGTGATEATPSVTVTPSSSSITMAQAVTVAVAVSGGTGNPTPTGSVTLSSGSYSAQQTLASGAASFTIASGTLGTGVNTLTASYSGDANYAAASSTATVTVEPVSITAKTPLPVNPGSSTTSSVTLTGSSSYSGTMNLGCSLTSSPAGAQSLPTCALNPTSVTLDSGGSGTSTLTVNTTAASATAQARPTDRHLWKLGRGGAVLAALLLFGIPLRRRRWTSMLVFLVLFASTWAIGCGGGGGTNGGGGGGGGSSTPATTAGSYTFTVAGTDSANAKITASTTVLVTVQ
jgi:hypothetical protein